MNQHDIAKTAILSYLNGYGDATRAIRDSYTANDFSGIVDALATFGPWDKRKREGELGKRIASLRVLLHRVGADMAEAAKELGQTIAIVTIESKDGQPLNIVAKKVKEKAATRFASFLAARKSIHKAISDLAALKTVDGFADFHTLALQALNNLEAMPEMVETRETRIVSVAEAVEAE